MTPVYISGCFGMLHAALGQRGVLILGSLGDEALNTYRPLVFLAERFAAAGHPTLRLEFFGAGDSAGEDDEPRRFQQWLDGIVAGVRWLRDSCGVRSVTLVGTRIGAAMAARAACECDGIEALILLAPVSSGRRFLRELVLAARTNAEIWQVEPRIDDGIWFEARGLRLNAATREALSHLDIGKLPSLPAPRALVLDEADSPANETVAERLRRQGVTVEQVAVKGFAAMLRDPYENIIPHDAFTRALAWHASLPESPGIACTARPTSPALSLQLEAASEQPVWFGPDERLLGILCEPAHRLPDAPVVLIANTGANPRYGNSRIGVMLARWLAECGIASLRMDGTAIGDSRPEAGERGQPYSPQGDLDARAGVDWLANRFTGPLVVFGMCSGAYHALQTAFADHRIRGLMLVNLQKFVWSQGESLSVVQRTTFRTTRFYLHHAASLATVQRLLRGEINVTGISRALFGRAARRLAASCDPALQRLRNGESPVGQVRRQVRELARRAVPILFILSGNDPGLDEIAEYFGAQGRQFRRLPNVSFHLLEGADHTLSAHWARRALMHRIASYLNRNFNVQALAYGVDETPEIARQQPIAPTDSGFIIPSPFAAKPIAIDTSGSAA